MTTFPTNLARVPTTLTSQLLLSSLTNTNQRLMHVNLQLASGKSVMRPSDDAVAGNTIAVLDDILERREQRLRNLAHAEGLLNNVDAALGDGTDLMIEAKSIGLSQIGVGSDAETRANQAKVIDSMLNEMLAIANRQYQDIFFFGGSATARPPMVELLGGFRYQGEGEGIVTDLGLSRSFAITMAGTQAFGAMSQRVQGVRDLDPTMTVDTRLVDLNGARGLGISLGTILVDVNGTDLSVDLSEAHTVGDVLNTLQTEIQTVDPGATVTIAASGNQIQITPSGGVTVTISDPAADATAADLGINTTFTGPAGGAGADVDPILTEMTPVSSLTGVTVPLGTIRLINAGQTRDLDLSGCQNVQDIMNAVEGLNIGVRVEIAETGDRLNFVNELSGGDMSIAEVAGGNTATELGVRSLTGETRLDDFNHGLGVQILSGGIDPMTGLPDPSMDLDFRITLKDGRTFDVDLAGAETVQDVLDMINGAATAAGIAVPAEFNAGLAVDGNGIELTDNTLPAGNTTSVEALNGSFAAEDLGIAQSTTSATLTGEDRATVAVDSVFTHLIDLRDALKANDERGIMLATDKLEDDISRLAEARADIGVRTQRVSDATWREEDLKVQDTALRSEVQDLDYTEASIRFANLQQQLQAALMTASQVQTLSL
ncbi:MAG: hypothetical protein JSV91_04545, partial [Phycisphaerales bacterium]